MESINKVTFISKNKIIALTAITKIIPKMITQINQAHNPNSPLTKKI